MNGFEGILALLVVVVALAWGARAVGLPYPIVLVVGGLGLGLLPGLPKVDLDPDVVFLVFLPPLVHAAAYGSSPRRLRADAAPIGLLAGGLVAVTIAVVAVVAHLLVGDLGWGAAVALGAIVAPTDPVAATAIFRRLGVSERISGVVEGESLLNDGTALVAYRLAVAAVVTGSFSVASGALDLVVVSVGGALVGLGIAAVSAALRRRLDDGLIEISVTVLTSYIAYVVAERLGVSGILAVVAAGVLLGVQGHRLFSPGTRLEAAAFWSVLVFGLESTLFILIGLQFPSVLDALRGSTGSLVLTALAIGAVLVVVRLAGAQLVPGRTRGERMVIGWSGMRGAISLAAALAIPLTTDAGTPFTGRDEIVFLTLCVIGLTLVGQGLTLPVVARRALRGAAAEPSDLRRHALARFDTVDAALERLADLGRDGEVAPPLVERAREMYTQRASQLAGECRVGVAAADTDTAAWLRLRLELLGVERRALVGARDRGEVQGPALVSVERDLDLEEERIRGRLAA